ncbi:MAG TPA: hypothetical protein VFA47_11070 [Candidatus Manganitrophaceae bacterium]|nr:hypothetical protein [Candidatus Manganitrophaceae bacterium]
MAGSTKAEFQAGVYPEQTRKEARHSPAEERPNRHIIGPGIDQFYEVFYRWGGHMLLAAMFYLSFWIIWAVDFSKSK